MPFPYPINCKDLGFRRVRIVGNINDDATGFDIRRFFRSTLERPKI
jgi:hypothetical protein